MARFLAHNLTQRSAILKAGMFGTSRRISSVTRDPFKLRIQRSSRFFKRLLSDNSRSSGIRASDNRAHTKSIYNHQLVSLFGDCWLKLISRTESDTHWYSGKVHRYDGYVSIVNGLLGSKVLLRYKEPNYIVCGQEWKTYRYFSNFLLLLEHVVHGGEEFLSFNMARQYR